MTFKKELWFWGYIDTDNNVYVKRYTTDRAIENAEKFPLTKGIFGPFKALNYQHAKQLCMNTYAQEIMKC